FIAAPNYSRETAGKELREKLDRRLTQLSQQFTPEVRTLLDRTRQGMRTLAERLEAISTEEAVKSTQYQKLIDEIEDSVESSPPAVRQQFETLRTQFFQEYRQLQLALSENERSNARKRVETARVKLNDFIATTFPQLSDKQRMLTSQEKEKSALTDYSLDLFKTFATIEEDERKIEAALLASAPQQTQKEFENASSNL